MRREMEKELLERVMPRTEQGKSVTRHDELGAIFGCNIVVTLCVYYPCQDAGAQRPRPRGRKLPSAMRPNHFEELYWLLLKRKGPNIAVE